MRIENKPVEPGLRRTLFEIIFEADTPGGRWFDILLLWAIVLSVVAVCLESVSSFRVEYGQYIRIVEWFFTGLFTIEYLVRIYCSRFPVRYVKSFFGIIDLLAVLPTYLSLLFIGSQYLIVIRTIRLLRVFRILKMTRYLGEAEVLVTALRASRHKITVFLGTVLSVVVVVGAAMHLIEGPEHGFTSIPHAMYWAIVTLTTVGYGDIAPQTIAGRFLASIVMILGYGIIAVPTGIVSVELSRAVGASGSRRHCEKCGRGSHDLDAHYCKQCGGKVILDEEGSR